MCPVFIVTSSKRVPYDVGHPFHKFSAGMSVSVVKMQRVDAALDERVEFRVQSFHNVQLDVG